MYRVSKNLLLLGLCCASTVLLPCASGHAEDTLNTTARGVLRSISESTLATDMSMRIVRIPFQAGQEFNKGDVLVSFDCERLEAELHVTEAEARGAKASFDSAVKMHAQRAAGALEVRVAQAQADKAAAAQAVAAIRTKPCRQIAPFSGRVVEVLVHEHDTPAVNAPLIKIVDADNIEVDLIVPSAWLRWLKTGNAFAFKIDETGQDISGTIARLGAAIDPISQTVKVVGRLDPVAVRAGSVLPGMSGNAVFHSGS